MPSWASSEAGKLYRLAWERADRAANPEKYRIRAKKKYERNREKILSQVKAHQERNRENIGNYILG